MIGSYVIITKPTVQGVRSINYYRARATILLGATSVNEVLFADQLGGGLNDLPDGILPDNRSGDLTALFVRARQPSIGTWASGQNSATRRVADVERLQDLQLTAYVNGVEVVRGPVWAFPHPPMWIQGGVAGTAPGAETWVQAQNSGYMLAALSHGVAARQRIQVRITGTPETAFAAAMPFEVVLQVLDTKAA